MKGIVDFIERLMGAIIVIGAAVAIVPAVVLPMVAQNQEGMGPVVTLIIMIAIAAIFIGGIIYIFREKHYS